MTVGSPCHLVPRSKFAGSVAPCLALEKVAETVILGTEPEEMETLGVEMTPTAASKVAPMIEMVLSEPDLLGGTYRKRSTNNVPGNTFQDC